MTSKRFCILLLALIAAGTAAGQSEDIPIENDNQFPPDDQSHDDAGAVIEGSGDDTIDEPPANAETTPVPLLESGIQNEETSTQAQEDEHCPKSCSCHFEGGTDNFVVDCSGNGLTEFPSPIDPKTTTLNIQNNKIAEIPKDIATLTNLKVLNADNNAIMDLALGSVSELAQLTVLKLSNNRLIDYPKDLKNSIDLTNLEELDLGGNDMRTELDPKTFSNFPSLRELTLAKSSPDLLQSLCITLKDKLETVCTESCKTSFYECQETSQTIEEGFIDAVLPGALESPTDDNTDLAFDDNTELGTEETPQEGTSEASNVNMGESVVSEGTTTQSGIKSRFGNTEQATPNMLNNIVAEAPKDEISHKTNETEVQVGATTDTKPGGVDKSIIGIIVAGMVFVVAGITIRKNWSYIRNRFTSAPRVTERGGANANGTTPEEVPLQDKDKSPV